MKEKSVGIIAEYNPFHNGHLYQLNESVRLTGAEVIIAAMSGNFVQRGGPAIADKLGQSRSGSQMQRGYCSGNSTVLHAVRPQNFAGAGVDTGKPRSRLYLFGSESGNIEELAEISGNGNKNYGK